MNNIFISHTSAFEFLRYNRNDLTPTKIAASSIMPNHKTKFSTEFTNDALKPFEGIISKPINLLLQNKNSFYTYKNYKIHIYKNNLPTGSFNKISNNIYIASPELTFLQLAETLPFEKLLLLGLEMCGTYSIDNESEYGFVSQREPYTSANKINNYIKQVRLQQNCYKNIRKASLAAKTLADNCASPQEALLYTMLASPRKYGGFGIKNIKLNKKIYLSKSGQKICGQKIIIPDLSIRTNKIAIEYDSDTFHDNQRQNRRDKLRIDALINDGWHVITFVPIQNGDFEPYSELAIKIMKLNNQDTRITRKDFEIENYKLMKSLYSNYNQNI